MLKLIFVLWWPGIAEAQELKVKMERWAGSDITPASILELESHVIGSQIFEPLIKATSNGTFEPLLCESWSFSPDKTALTIKLRSDLKFSNGEKLTSDHVFKMVQSVVKSKVVQGLSNIQGANGRNLHGFKILSPLEFTLKFQQAYPAALIDLADLHAAITTKDKNNRRLGTGPFVLEESNNSSKTLSLIRNNFYRGIVSNILKIYFSTDKNLNYDISIDSDFKLAEKISYFDTEVYFLGFNLAKKPFDDFKVRSTLVSYLKSMLKDQRSLPYKVSGFVPLGLLGYNSNLKVEFSEQQIKIPQLQIWSYQPRLRDNAQKYCTLLKQHSIDCSIKNTSFKELVDETANKHAGIFFARLKPSIPSARDLLGVFSQNSEINLFTKGSTDWLSKKLASLSNRLLALPLDNSETSTDLIKEIDETLVTNAVVAPIFYGAERYIYHSRGIKLPHIGVMGVLELEFSRVEKTK